MSANLRLVFVASGFEPAAGPEVERRVREVLEESDCLRNSAVASTPHAIVAYVLEVHTRAAAADETRVRFEEAVAAAGGVGHVECEEVDPERTHQAHFDVSVVHFELVDEPGALEGLPSWLQGRAEPPSAIEAIAPLVEEAQWVRQEGYRISEELAFDSPRRRPWWAPRAALQRCLHAAHAWSVPDAHREVVVERDPPVGALREAVGAVLGPNAPLAAIADLAPAWSPPKEIHCDVAELSLRPGGHWVSHDVLKRRQATIVQAAQNRTFGAACVAAVENALATGCGLVAYVEGLWPELAPRGWPVGLLDRSADRVAPDWGIRPAPLERWEAIARRAVDESGLLGELRLEPPSVFSLAPRPELTPPSGRGIHLPQCTQDLLTSTEESVDLTGYWRAAQQDWEVLLVESLFPLVGPGFRLDLRDAPSWGEEGVEARLRATFATREALAFAVSFPRDELDGAISSDTGEILRMPLVQDQDRVRSWRRALAGTHADFVTGPEAVWLDPPERVAVGLELRRLLDFLAQRR